MDTVFQLYEDGFPGVLGLIDADFDRITGKVVEHEGICISEYHDYDMDMVLSTALDKYLAEVAEKKIVELAAGVDRIRETIMNSIMPLSTLRYLNEINQLGYDLKKIAHQDFYDGKICDIDKMVDSVSFGKFQAAATREASKSQIVKTVGKDLPLNQVTSGHDFCAALGIALRSEIGNRRDQQTWRSEIELHLRLAYSVEEFQTSYLFQSIKSWEKENPPYKITKVP